MKKITLLLSILLLTACSASYKETTQGYVLPEELKDCKIFTLSGETLNQTLYVVRCPDSNTTTNWTKTTMSGKTTTTHHYSVTIK